MGPRGRHGIVGAAIGMAISIALAIGSGRPAQAGEPAPAELAGQVVVSDVMLAPGVGAVALKRFQRAVVRQVAGFWRLHMMAFLDREVDGDAVALGVYDVTSPGERKQVKVFDVPVESGARTVHLNDFVVSPPMGFEAGHKYEVAIEPAGGDRGGKRDAYAKGVVTLR